MFRLASAILVLVAACTPEVPPPTSGPVSEPLPFFSDGYRAAGDQCRRVGEDPRTVEYLDDAADLVGCPADMENLGVFVADTNARFLATIDGTNLYSVPVR